MNSAVSTGKVTFLPRLLMSSVRALSWLLRSLSIVDRGTIMNLYRHVRNWKHKGYSYGLHFTNAPIDVHTVLSLGNLSHCQLMNATLSLFVGDLLPGHGEGPLGLNGCLLDLN